MLFTDIPNSLVNLSVAGHGPYYPDGEEVEYVLQNFKGLRTLSVDEMYFYDVVTSLLRGLPDLEYLSLDGASVRPPKLMILIRPLQRVVDAARCKRQPAISVLFDQAEIYPPHIYFGGSARNCSHILQHHGHAIGI